MKLSGDTLKTILGATAIGLGVGLVVFLAADALGGKKLDFKGTLIDKEYRAPHTTTSTSYDGERWRTRTTHHPARWTLEVDLHGVHPPRLRVNVGRGLYEEAKLGDVVWLTAIQGRWTGGLGFWTVTGVGPVEKEK